MARTVSDESLLERLAVFDQYTAEPGGGPLLDRADLSRCSLETELSERHALANERYALVKAQQSAVASMRRYLVHAREELRLRR